MTKISSFKIAAGMFGVAALAKISVFAIAVTMLGLATSAQAGSLGQPCTTAPQNQWLSVEAMQSKAEALGYKVQKLEKNACGEVRFTLEKLPRRA
jgi:hypothetical protein